ncbi:sigma-70 family RNA polymerase sigma factor (plasmid) [Streptomyces sp. WAC07094]|uniref:sigma-70 family RNA polymerase sigma factor n=1 Tax=Streptomyces sp. WAC07094 TaxID=3072183 RepID=UPI002EBCBBB8|nr:sigma-70 family RNA polymerase sigma factor [Streptomyces sp. WAC07094]
MTSTTDAAVASAAHRNQLLHTLMSDHAKALVAYAAKLLNDHHMAEDIVQETLIRAWSHAERLYSTEGSIRGWLLKVTRNLVVDKMRSAAARHETLDAHDRDMPLPDHSGTVLTSVETIELLRQLSHEHREVLLHTYLCGRTAQETARILGIPAGTVKSRQHYALNTLRAKADRGLRPER